MATRANLSALEMSVTHVTKRYTNVLFTYLTDTGAAAGITVERVKALVNHSPIDKYVKFSR